MRTIYYLSSPGDIDPDPTLSVEDMLRNLKERIESGRRVLVTWHDGDSGYAVHIR